jgi:phosphoribosylaminoimidazole-succinocarboxamide synthase
MGNLYLIDEVGTPDSSRFWKKEGFQEGEEPESYDKEPTRQYVAEEWKKS